MSSTGIAALVDADYQARQRRKALRIVARDNRAVWTPLRLSGVDKMLRLQTDPGMDPT
jgi:anti-anti-sigma regulatory factor